MSMGMTRRARSAYAARMEAKRRRQRVYVVVGLLLLAGLAAFEVPKTIKLLKGHSSSDTAASTSTTPVATAPVRQLPKSLRRVSPSDPFQTRALANGDPQVGAATGGRDPFATPAAPASTPVATTQPLPEQIVIGNSGGNRKATHGWIVILASIPTAEGRGSAEAFASKVQRLGNVSILNSSNRRPLRGGYWVVYTGPYDTVAQVSTRATQIHSAGYPSAYIRELIVYR